MIYSLLPRRWIGRQLLPRLRSCYADAVLTCHASDPSAELARAHASVLEIVPPELAGVALPFYVDFAARRAGQGAEHGAEWAAGRSVQAAEMTAGGADCESIDRATDGGTGRLMRRETPQGAPYAAQGVQQCVCAPQGSLPILHGGRFCAVSLCLVLHTLPPSRAVSLLEQCRALGVPCLVLDACLAERTISMPSAAAVGFALWAGSGGNYAGYVRFGAIEGLLYRAGLVPHTRHMVWGGGLTLAMC